jgi:hypothetical protein
VYLLDTNVVSELRRPRPHGGVLAWLRGVPDDGLFVSAVTLGELQAGVENTRAEDETKAAAIEAWLDQLAQTANVLAMDGAIFRTYARLMHRQPEGLIEDAMIAATALCHGLTVATRNSRHLQRFGVKTIDPFTFRQE